MWGRGWWRRNRARVVARHTGGQGDLVSHKALVVEPLGVLTVLVGSQGGCGGAAHRQQAVPQGLGFSVSCGKHKAWRRSRDSGWGALRHCECLCQRWQGALLTSNTRTRRRSHTCAHGTARAREVGAG